MNLNVVGTTVPRLDAWEKVTGQARYGVGLEVPGMLYGKILRSIVPHARLLRIDIGRALALPGVRAILTRDDLLGNPTIDPYFGPAIKDQPLVALDKVRYVGDPVAAVAARDEETASEALKLIEVAYEGLPLVEDPVAAMQPGAPLVHEQLARLGGGFADLRELHPIAGTNVCNHFSWRLGDVAQGFRESDEIFEDTFTCTPTQHCALEPHVTLASWDQQGRLCVWSATQTPFNVRTQLSEIFRLPTAKVRVIVPYLGGGFGSKTYPKLEPLVAALARKAGAPVRVVLSREEVFLTITKHGCVFRIKTGVKRDGTLVARQCAVIWDTGAYADIGPRVSKKAGATVAGPYQIPHVQIDSYCVYTNKPPAGAFRGFGVQQAAWAYESQMDLIARRLGIDPYELRVKNLLDEGSVFVTGEELYSVGFKESLSRAAQALNWDKPVERQAPGGRRRGRGIACMIKSTLTPSLSTAQVRLNEDGSLNVITSTVEMGQGSDTVLCQIAAEALGMSLEDVAITHPDTDVTPYDITTSSSRSTFHMGKALQLAAAEVKQQLFAIAADILEANPQDLETRQGRIWVKGSERNISFAEAMGKRFGMQGGNLWGEGTVQAGGVQKTRRGVVPITSSFWFVGAAAAEVEVDPETGEVLLTKLVTAADVGKAINPQACEGQLEGGAITGLGQTFSEELVFAEGQPVNATFMDYRIPSIGDLPEQMEAIMVEVPHPEGPYGAKGVGETSLIPIPPAIANAIHDAVGARIKDLPITPEKVLRALRQPRA